MFTTYMYCSFLIVWVFYASASPNKKTTTKKIKIQTSLILATHIKALVKAFRETVSLALQNC